MIQACARAIAATGKVIGFSATRSTATPMNGTVCAAVTSVHRRPARVSELSLARGRQ
jgi:hypothetical protein